MKLSNEIEYTWVITKNEIQHLNDLTQKISQIIEDIIDKENLTIQQKESFNNLDKLSLLKLSWKTQLIKTIINDCISDDIPIVSNENWMKYQLEIFDSKYYLEVTHELITNEQKLYSIEWNKINDLIDYYFFLMNLFVHIDLIFQ